MTSDRTISILSMIGSACFAVGAVIPDSGALRNAMMVNLGACLGALCFLVGAYLLLPRTPAKETLTVGGTPA